MKICKDCNGSGESNTPDKACPTCKGEGEVKEKYYTIIPIKDQACLFEFDGTFDEGEGMSMGEPIMWKHPLNTVLISKICSLWKLDTYPMDVVKRVFNVNSDIDEIYLEGVKDYTGWYKRSDVE